MNIENVLTCFHKSTLDLTSWFCNVKQVYLTTGKETFGSKENDSTLLPWIVSMRRQKLFFPDGVSTSARKAVAFLYCSLQWVEMVKKGKLFNFFKKKRRVLVGFMRDLYFWAKSPQFLAITLSFFSLFLDKTVDIKVNLRSRLKISSKL